MATTSTTTTTTTAANPATSAPLTPSAGTPAGPTALPPGPLATPGVGAAFWPLFYRRAVHPAAAGPPGPPATVPPLSPGGPTALPPDPLARPGVGAAFWPLFFRRARHPASVAPPGPAPPPVQAPGGFTPGGPTAVGPPSPPPPPVVGDVGDVRASVSDAQLRVSWRASGVPGQRYQVYLDRRLAWAGTATFCVLPHPTARVQIDVAAVAPAAAGADLSGSLPPVPGGGGRVRLAWLGGSFEGPGLASFHVFAGAAPGAAPSLTGTPSAVVAAYPQGLAMDGFGMGGFGAGGFGAAASSYAWTSPPLAPGVWEFAVVPVDSGGNPGPAVLASAAVSGPPGPPARDALGLRLVATPGRQTPGGFGTGGMGTGGFGTGAGFGSGGFGTGPFGVGTGDGPPVVTLDWLPPDGS